jgi:hypothetical protein
VRSRLAQARESVRHWRARQSARLKEATRVFSQWLAIQASRAGVRRFAVTALGAAFVTLFAVVAHEFHILEQSDRAVFAALSRIGPVRSAPSIMVTIDQEFFDRNFEGQSPLRPVLLAKVIEKFAASGSALAIDLDLSPRGPSLDSFKGAPANESACHAATLAHRPIERVLCDRKPQSRVVIAAPFATDSGSALAKLRWMQSVCKIPNVDFALPQIPSPIGPYVVDYYESGMTLAGALDAHDQGLCSKIPTGQVSHLPTAFGFLDRTLASIAFEDDIRTNLDPEKVIPLDFRRRPDVRRLSQCWPDNCVNAATAHALFLGGTWENNGADEFMAPAEFVPGLQLHAIAYRSELRRIPSWVGVAIEFIFGMLLIVFFGWLWGIADRSLGDVVDTLKIHGVWSRAMVRPATRYASLVLLVPAAAAAIAILVLAGVAVLFSRYHLAAPTALLLSILVKAYIEREPRDDHVLTAPWWFAHLPHAGAALVAILVLDPWRLL